MNRPWMPLYIGDYLGDTGHLTTTQHGAYLLLMMHYWRKGGLPDDDRQLAAISGLTLQHFRYQQPTLQAFFFDGWKHKRIDGELEKMFRISQGRSRAGYKGGIKSAMSRMRLEDTVNGQANGKQKPSNCSNFAQAPLDHSHSQSKKEASQGIVASPELVALLQKR
jgi:uncharacterized protein YdaU (DUF1376 family)